MFIGFKHGDYLSKIWPTVFSFVYALSRGCIQIETWGMGPYAVADYNFTLSHSRLRSQLSTPPTSTKGMGRGWAHLYLSANFDYMFFFVNMNWGEYREGGGKGWELR
jgi:hypothetical protein